ncbi:MAG TPA: hypothetical protein VGM32_24560 [Rhodopila sp.]
MSAPGKSRSGPAGTPHSEHGTSPDLVNGALKADFASTAGAAQPAGSHLAELAHAVQGRVRLKIPAAQHNPELLHQIKAAISKIPGVDAVDVKAKSGSVIIYYDHEHHADISTLLQYIDRMKHTHVKLAPAGSPVRPPPNKIDELTGNIADEAEFLAEHSTIAKTVVEAVKKLDRDIKRSTGNNLDLKVMVPVALAGVTFLEVGAAAATPMWVTLAIFSLNHFVELHAHDADKE